VGTLGCSTVLLGLTGWEVGRGGKLTTRERIVSALFAAVFGGAMILLKTLWHERLERPAAGRPREKGGEVPA
jgi:hypothetical protein